MSLKVPGKTFLFVEYAVLVGGEALGLATKPYFELSELKTDYHKFSAVNRLNHKFDFKFDKQINNPYNVGGFGASTAEFIFTWNQLKGITKNNITEIFEEYLNLYTNDLASQPSGGDLITQLLGKVTHFKKPINLSESFDWPFAQIYFYIISTGFKINTHEHLAALDRKRLIDLPRLSKNVIHAFEKTNAELFLSELKVWKEKLIEIGLNHKDVLAKIKPLEENKNVLLVKPCGALGADVCLVFCYREQKEIINNLLIYNNFEIKATVDDLVPGVVL